MGVEGGVEEQAWWEGCWIEARSHLGMEIFLIG